MPQLIPFYFVNQAASVFILIVVLLYVFSKFILPRNVSLYLSRMYVSKTFNINK